MKKIATEKKAKDYLVAIRIRSAINASSKVKQILDRLGLRKKLCMAVFDNKADMEGQLKEVKDYVTYGIITEDFLKEVLDKRGELYKGRLTDSKSNYQFRRVINVGGKKYKPYIRLHPPIGGFERKGIKKPYATGGALGDRKDRIKELITKML